jgi:dihydrofolate reductase
MLSHPAAGVRRRRERPQDRDRQPQDPTVKEFAMSKIIAVMSMSLDGFVADEDDGVAEVFDWYTGSGDVDIRTGGSDPMTFSMSAPSAAHFRRLTAELGAVLTGRRTFDVAHGWGGNHAWGPAFVLTHHVPEGWPRPDSTVQFVTDGVHSAVARAAEAAGGKSVGVHGADTIRQCLDAGLLDEIHIDLAAVLLGSGVRLFDRLSRTPAVLGDPTVVHGVGVTHLRYPVSKPFSGSAKRREYR